jgi:transketolase
MTESPVLSNAISLQERALRIRRHALRMGEVQGQGYIAQALGVADVLAVAYFHALTYRAEDPHWEGRDRFLLSIGHYAIAFYAALIEAGILPLDELETYGADASRLPMSGMASYTPGMEISGGSLGLGLPIAVGMALGLKRKKSAAFVYNLMSDGELGEGSTWEAAMSAAHWKLDNFGWHTQRVDGNDIDALRAAFDSARSLAEPRPRAIICDTRMGKGVPFLETRERNHFLRVDPHEWALAIDALDAGRVS